MAYKPVIYKNLPFEVIEFANEKNFPILEFGGDEFFEDIIFAVSYELNDGEDIASLEADLSKILEQDASPKEELKIRKKINSDFKRYIRVAAIKDHSLQSEEDIICLVKKIASLERINKKASLTKFKDSYFIFLSQDTANEARFKALLADIFIALEIDENKISCGLSSILSTNDNFGKAIREAFWACNVAVLENDTLRYYNEIGIYRLIIPEIHSKNLINYMAEYLSPLGDISAIPKVSHEYGNNISYNGDSKNTLLETACTYILARGDLDETASRMFCHKNTIRYRLSKLHDLLDPYCNEKEFQENLSMAIRIYMLSNFL